MAKVNLDARTRAIVDAANNDMTVALGRDDHAEAKRVLTGAIRDLRDYKRELTEAERSIREQFQAARLKTRQSGQTVGLFVSSKTRGAMSRARATQGRNLTAQQADALAPYARAKSNVDRAIATLDRAKADITDAVARSRESAPTASVESAPRKGARSGAEVTPPAASTPPPPPVPPMWTTDPSGRHEHRYWDGSRWTEHVANGGVTDVDPL